MNSLLQKSLKASGLPSSLALLLPQVKRAFPKSEIKVTKEGLQVAMIVQSQECQLVYRLNAKKEQSLNLYKGHFWYYNLRSQFPKKINFLDLLQKAYLFLSKQENLKCIADLPLQANRHSVSCLQLPSDGVFYGAGILEGSKVIATVLVLDGDCNLLFQIIQDQIQLKICYRDKQIRQFQMDSHFLTVFLHSRSFIKFQPDEPQLLNFVLSQRLSSTPQPHIPISQVTKDKFKDWDFQKLQLQMARTQSQLQRSPEVRLYLMRLYEQAIEMLSAQGIDQYEIYVLKLKQLFAQSQSQRYKQQAFELY